MDFNADMAELARRYPNLWRSIDLIRAQGQQRFSECEWPPDVFLTDEAISAIMHGTASAISGVDQWPDDMSRIGALSAWRPTQDIYKIDPDLLEALMTTPLEKIPVSALRLPVWSLYVDMPETRWEGISMRGFFAWAGCVGDLKELRITPVPSSPDEPWAVVPVALHEEIPLMEAVMSSYDRRLRVGEMGLACAHMVNTPQFALLRRAMEKFVSIVLYLCSRDIDWRPGESGPPSALPAPKKTRNGWRLFAPEKPRVWRIGERIGEKIREARRDGRCGGHAGPRPHVRRAHWHGFWSGPRKPGRQRTFSVQWLPPIAVAMVEETEK